MPARPACRRLPLPIAALLALTSPGWTTAASASPYPATAAFTASDAPDLWTAAGGGHAATIALGGAVTFQAATVEAHDAVFASSSIACQSGGEASGPRVPANPSATWDGSCTFSAPGYHPFVCSLHDGMSGEVAVAGADGVLPSREAPPTAPAAGSSTATQTPFGQPMAFVAAPQLVPQLVVERTQRGAVLRGTVAAAGAGASATIDVVAHRRDLAAPGRRPTGVVRLRRIRRASDGAGAIAFSVALGRSAQRAVARRGRLSLLVRASISGPRIATGRATRQQRVTLVAATARSPARAVVQVRNDLFTPGSVTIRRGGTVTWTWRSDGRPHDVVVARGGRSPIRRSGTYRRRFARTGLYRYVCSLHDGMAGTVRVRSR